jgi:hypothetical protein
MELFDAFLQERLYLKGVSPSTIRYYGNVKTAFAPILNAPTKAGRVARTQEILKRGTSPVSVNTWLLAVVDFHVVVLFSPSGIFWP